MCYRPFHVVEYYRYMRFFIDGKAHYNFTQFDCFLDSGHSEKTSCLMYFMHVFGDL